MNQALFTSNDLDADPRAAGIPRHSGAAGSELLALVLDEIDYPVLVVGTDGILRFGNHLAMHECSGAGPLQLLQGQVSARHRADQGALTRALADAERGRRSLLPLQDTNGRVTVAVVPLRTGADAHVLLVLAKRQVCESLSVSFFSKLHALTPAENTVLLALCKGLRPREIAEHQCVAISTIRTQVSSIRSKTAAGSIRELVKQVATLPPIAPAVKMAAVH
ncbi:helix-turn-helix transcriptional regulator [Methylibium rhizosphaerae]|uniref:helix-turn-helix transcriptional regulator n=1 Tax=Methylibium rhizosphaerae TaxID=2570323 RepID=UPI001129E6AA|nr:LuxR C-terminal-related transcriptional regulator [Methylibium rhizosphaerae]